MCCSRVCKCYLDGLRDGLDVGVRYGYRAGYRDGSDGADLALPMVRSRPVAEYYAPREPFQHERYDALLRPPCYCRGTCSCGRRQGYGGA